MPPKGKDIFRNPSAVHFQLVHRSLRDPESANPDASQQVLKVVERENERKAGSSKAGQVSCPFCTPLRLNFNRSYSRVPLPQGKWPWLEG